MSVDPSDFATRGMTITLAHQIQGIARNRLTPSKLIPTLGKLDFNGHSQMTDNRTDNPRRWWWRFWSYEMGQRCVHP